MVNLTQVGTEYLVDETPWPDLSSRNREWYDPYMMAAYINDSMWYRIVQYVVNMRPTHAKTINLTSAIPAMADIEEQSLRGITLPRVYYDSMEQEITVTNYGAMIQAHKWDAMIYQWAEKARSANRAQYVNDGIPQTDLFGFIQNRLGPQMVETMDVLARNAFLSNSKYRSFASDATGFHDLAAGDTFNPEIARSVQLGADYTIGTDVSFPAVVSPSATYAAKQLATTDDYIDWNKAVQNPQLLNYVVAEFENVSWIHNWRMVLWNCGEVLAQASITEVVNVGDGAPDPASERVDDTFAVGSPDATHYLQVSAISDPTTAETGFKANDKVTLHRYRPTADAAMAVEDGVQWNHHANIDAEVYSVDYTNNRITLKLPVLNEKYSTALGTGMYGWVTKARDVHAAVFFKKGLGNPGVVAGVMQSPQFHILPPMDVRQAVYSFSWDAYMKYQMVDPDAFEIHFYAGAIRRGGSVLAL
jgi:hypothetical protein